MQIAMPRPFILAAVLLVAACSSQSDTLLTGRPSITTARVALAGGSGDIALNICNGLLEQRPTDTDLLVCRGDALVVLGRNAEAASVYDRALALNPRASDAKIGLGRLRLATDPTAAELLFLDALTSNPRNAVALNNLGVARDLLGRHADAQVAYGEAIAAAPDLRGPQVNLALSLGMSGRAGDAVRMLRPIGERADATPRERHDLAAVLAMDGKSDEAARLLRQDMDGPQADDAINGFKALPARR